MPKHPDDVVNQMIAITKKQKDAMKKLGSFGESYSDIMQRLLDYWKESHKKIKGGEKQ